MNITQTVEVPANRRLTIIVPSAVPEGRTIITFTPCPVKEQSEERDIELINRNAERLNHEAMDVLSFQNIDI